MGDDGLVADGISRSIWNMLPGTLNLKQMHTETYSVTAISYEGVVIALYDLWTVWGNREGSLDMPMKVSRDMKTWEDVEFPRRALEVGRFGEWDAGMVYGGNTMLVINDEIRLYYLGANRGHSTAELPLTKPWHTLGMGLATLRLDGFVSLRADEKQGVITTKPLKFEGNEMIVNAACEKCEASGQ